MAVVLLLAGCGKECEGERVFSHHILIYQPALKQNILIPKYRCVIKDQDAKDREAADAPDTSGAGIGGDARGPGTGSLVEHQRMTL